MSDLNTESQNCTPVGHERLVVRLLHRKLGRVPFEMERVCADDPRHASLAPADFKPARPEVESRIEARIVRLSRKLDALSKKWDDNQRKLPEWANKVVGWLQRFKRHDEDLLRALCSVEAVQVEHPASWKPSKARKAWRHQVRAGRRGHLIGLAISLVLLPISLVMSILPGPNVLGFWFSYRALSHALAWLGAGRVLKGGLPVTLVPVAESSPQPTLTPSLVGP